MASSLAGENLVYGDFSGLLKTKVSGSVDEFRDMDVELKNLEASLFAGFISYIFAWVGYYNRTIYENSRYWGEGETGPILAPEGRRTTDDTSEMWVDEVGGLVAWSEELNELTADGVDALMRYPERLRGSTAWSHYFEKVNTKAKAKVIFTSREAWKSLSNETLLNFLDPSCPNYVMTRPGEKKFTRPLSMHSVSFLSVDEFLEKLIPAKEERFAVLKNWIEIRDEALKRFRGEQHMLAGQSQMTRKLAKVAADLAMKKQFDDAIAIFEAILKQEPNFALGHVDLGHAYSDKGMTDKAIECYNEAIRIDPNLVDPYDLLACVYREKGLLDEAITYFKRALSVDPSDEHAHFNLGFTYAQKGVPDEAIEELKEALTLNPSNVVGHVVLARAYGMKG